MAARGGPWLGLGVLACTLAVSPCAVLAQIADSEPPEERPAPEGEAEPAARRLEFGVEAKVHFRQSDENRFPVRFPFTPDMLPPGQTQGFEETVDAGSHFEISAVTLFVDAIWSEGLAAHAKIDAIDLYERNPTSTGEKLDVDELWIRFGRSPQPAEPAERSGLYLKAGKFPKFERQNDRHLESYGLVSTAFNRLEDVGVELGVAVGRHLYLKGSATQGNPVFLRDPNALAGDNGIPGQGPSPDPELKTGIVIPYDGATQDLDGDRDPQLGAGVGLRFSSADGTKGIDVLAFGRRRDLAETIELENTFYGGDLDLLDGPGIPGLDVRFPVTGDRKQEVGGNLWLYCGGLSVFAQYVDQDLGGLPRTGAEVEVAWRFELPLFAGVAGRQLFPSVAPALRYSKLDPDFRAPTQTPSPSFAWEWEKWDAGVRLEIVDGIDLTAEYAANRFILGSGAEAENDEALATLRWRM